MLHASSPPHSQSNILHALSTAPTRRHRNSGTRRKGGALRRKPFNAMPRNRTAAKEHSAVRRRPGMLFVLGRNLRGATPVVPTETPRANARLPFAGERPIKGKRR